MTTVGVTILAEPSRLVALGVLAEASDLASGTSPLPLAALTFPVCVLIYILYVCNRFQMEVNMSLSKRLKRLWTLLITEEYFDEHGSRGRRNMVRRAPRA